MQGRWFRESTGLSLLELMVAVAIIAIMAAIAIPSYLAGKPGRELRADALDLAGSLKLAKLNAVKRNVNTGLIFSGVGGRTYTMYEDDGATANQYDGGDTVVSEKSNVSLRGGNQFSALTCPNNTIIFATNGTAIPSSGTVTISNTNGETRNVIVLMNTGRIRIQ